MNSHVDSTKINYNHCKKCLDIQSFNKNKDSPTGFRSVCRNCTNHIARLRYKGIKIKVSRKSWQERFWEKVNKTDTCWLWTSSKTRGYGTFNKNGKNQYAHRVCFELFKEPIKKGFHLDHLCRTPLCCNPDHLEIVTPLENVRRGIYGILRTHCKRGHKNIPENNYV